MVTGYPWCPLQETPWRKSFVPSVKLAMLYALAGNTDKMLDWIEKGYIRKNPNMPYMGVTPVYRPYYDEPRFIEIMQRMNLPV